MVNKCSPKRKDVVFNYVCNKYALTNRRVCIMYTVIICIVNEWNWLIKKLLVVYELKFKELDYNC